MDITDQLAYLYSLERLGIKMGLEHTEWLLSRCGNPHQKIKSIQIAGTNGKGSTAAFLDAILRRHGVKTGLYTSPHLAHFNERIRVNALPISDRTISGWVRDNRPALDDLNCTFFEATTVMAMNYFVEEDAEIAILETGLGGRLDSTTACDAAVMGLTPIALDHTEILGESIKEIAKEKAGILKQGRRCYYVSQNQDVQTIIKAEAARIGAPLFFVPIDESIQVPKNLPGRHQITNASLAWALAENVLEGMFDSYIAAEAIKGTIWPGRYQQVGESPRVIFDVGHNPHGVASCLEILESEAKGGNRVLVLALQGSKNADDILDQVLPLFEEVIFTQTDTRNFLPARELMEKSQDRHSSIYTIENSGEAILKAMGLAGGAGLVLILGTHYLGPTISELFKISFDKLS